MNKQSQDLNNGNIMKNAIDIKITTICQPLLLFSKINIHCFSSCKIQKAPNLIKKEQIKSFTLIKKVLKQPT